MMQTQQAQQAQQSKRYPEKIEILESKMERRSSAFANESKDGLLEPLDLLLLLINDVLLLPDDAQQLPDQWSLFLRKSLQHLLYRRRPCHPRSRTNSPISEKTNRHGVIENSPFSRPIRKLPWHSQDELQSDER